MPPFFLQEAIGSAHLFLFFFPSARFPRHSGPLHLDRMTTPLFGFLSINGQQFLAWWSRLLCGRRPAISPSPLAEGFSPPQSMWRLGLQTSLLEHRHEVPILFLSPPPSPQVNLRGASPPPHADEFPFFSCGFAATAVAKGNLSFSSGLRCFPPPYSGGGATIFSILESCLPPLLCESKGTQPDNECPWTTMRGIFFPPFFSPPPPPHD